MPVELMYETPAKSSTTDVGLLDLRVGGVKSSLGLAVDVARELDHGRPSLVAHASFQLSGRHPRHPL